MYLSRALRVCAHTWESSAAEFRFRSLIRVYHWDSDDRNHPKVRNRGTSDSSRKFQRNGDRRETAFDRVPRKVFARVPGTAPMEKTKTGFSSEEKLRRQEYRMRQQEQREERSRAFTEASQRREELRDKYGTSKLTVLVTGAGAFGECRCLYVMGDTRTYLFNGGEGIQRIITEGRGKMGRIGDVFVTRARWENIGGLPGLAISLNDTGVPELNIHGPNQIERILTETADFVQIKMMKINVHNTKPFNDGVLEVTPVPLSRRGDSGSPSSSPKAKRKKGESPDDIVVAYIVRGPPKTGTLDLARCLDLGVPPGPLLGQLKRGESVTLSDGSKVTPEQVVSATIPGQVLIVVDCPSTEFISSFLAEKSFEPFYAEEHRPEGGKEDIAPGLVVHMCPPEVVRDPEYKTWLQRFPRSTTHWVLNEEMEYHSLTQCYKNQMMLNRICENVFPLLKGGVKPPIDGDDGTRLPLVRPLGGNSVQAVSDFRYEMVTSAVHTERFHYSQIARVDLKEVEDTLNLNPYFLTVLEDLKPQIQRKQEEEEALYPKVIFLGTGSSMSSKFRNGSAIMVSTAPRGYFLLDCSEGTLSQVVRFYGAKKSKKVLRCLDGIFVSHHHADHHLGLISIFKARWAAWEEKHDDPDGGRPFRPVIAILPRRVQLWLKWYDEKFEPISHLYEFVSPNSLLFENGSEEQKAPKPSEEENCSSESLARRFKSVSKVQTCRVKHCFEAYGIRLDFEDGFSLVYSGDTRPSDMLAALGENCDLLIHEATMEDFLQSEARNKSHCTVQEALDIQKTMKAKHCLLTHFSQRYSKVPSLTDEQAKTVGVAFDFMHVTRADLPAIPLFHPALKELYWEALLEHTERKVKKMYKDEREKAAQITKLARTTSSQ